MKTTLQKIFFLLTGGFSRNIPTVVFEQGQINNQIKEAVRESNLDQQKVLKEYQEKFSAAR